MVRIKLRRGALSNRHCDILVGDVIRLLGQIELENFALSQVIDHDFHLGFLAPVIPDVLHPVFPHFYFHLVEVVQPVSTLTAALLPPEGQRLLLDG